MAGVQWWLCIWCKFESSDGLLEQLLNCHVCCDSLGATGLPSQQEMEYGWMGMSCIVTRTSLEGCRADFAQRSAQAVSPVSSPPHRLLDSSHLGRPLFSVLLLAVLPISLQKVPT